MSETCMPGVAPDGIIMDTTAEVGRHRLPRAVASLASRAAVEREARAAITAAASLRVTITTTDTVTVATGARIKLVGAYHLHGMAAGDTITATMDGTEAGTTATTTTGPAPPLRPPERLANPSLASPKLARVRGPQTPPLAPMTVEPMVIPNLPKIIAAMLKTFDAALE